jgi:hypothetical protein
MNHQPCFDIPLAQAREVMERKYGFASKAIGGVLGYDADAHGLLVLAICSQG